MKYKQCMGCVYISEEKNGKWSCWLFDKLIKDIDNCNKNNASLKTKLFIEDIGN